MPDPDRASVGGRITVDAPYSRMPLYVRGGSIIPVGPEIEWTGEKRPDNLLIVVYAGADASFTLYEDDGLTYGYERGECSKIAFDWNDGERKLTIRKRDGGFPGMVRDRRFRIAVCSESHPFAWDPDAEGVASVEYDGTKDVEIKL